MGSFGTEGLNFYSSCLGRNCPSFSPSLEAAQIEVRLQLKVSTKFFLPWDFSTRVKCEQCFNS